MDVGVFDDAVVRCGMHRSCIFVETNRNDGMSLPFWWCFVCHASIHCVVKNDFVHGLLFSFLECLLRDPSVADKYERGLSLGSVGNDDGAAAGVVAVVVVVGLSLTKQWHP